MHSKGPFWDHQTSPRTPSVAALQARRERVPTVLSISRSSCQGCWRTPWTKGQKRQEGEFQDCQLWSMWSRGSPLGFSFDQPHNNISEGYIWFCFLQQYDWCTPGTECTFYSFLNKCVLISFLLPPVINLPANACTSLNVTLRPSGWKCHYFVLVFRLRKARKILPPVFLIAPHYNDLLITFEAPENTGIFP